MNRRLALQVFFAVLAIFLLPSVDAIIANSTTYDIDSMHTGLAANNATTTTYTIQKTLTTYQQYTDTNVNTLSYRLNLGTLGDAFYTCGDGIVSYHEKCDAGSSNGACPSACSIYCTLNDCPAEEDDGGSHSSGGSGSSSGSSGGSYIDSNGWVEPPTTYTAYVSKNFDVLPIGTETINFNSSKIPVITVLLMVDEESSNVRFVIRETNTTNKLSGKIYKYMEIEHTGLADSSIVQARIRFKVSKAYLANNSLKKENIVLLRYDTAWSALATSVYNEDTKYVYFEATTPGLSLFAIGDKSAVPSNPTNAITGAVANTPNLTNASTASNTSLNTSANTSRSQSSSGLSTSKKQIEDKVSSITIPWNIVGMTFGGIFLLVALSLVIIRHTHEPLQPKPEMKKEELDTKLKEWILRQKVTGHTDRQIEEYLLNKGYPKEKIDEIMLEIMKL